jgi:hypothetical protein
MTAPATRTKKSLAALRGANPAGQTKVHAIVRNFTADVPSMEEPRLRDMLQDPILLRLMQSDGVEPAQLLTLLADARRGLL